MDRTVVVTGVTSGIGLGMAKAFAANGDDIVLKGFGSPDLIQSTKSEMDRMGSGVAIHHPADMTKPDEIADLIDCTVKSFGSADVLVSNAGVQKAASVAAKHEILGLTVSIDGGWTAQ